jgi:hypothetical protein
MSSQLPMALARMDDPPLSDSDSDQTCFPNGSGSGPSQGAKTRRHALRKRRFLFSSESELALLWEFLVSVPWEVQYGDVGSAWDAKTCVLPDMMLTENVQKQKLLRLLRTGGLRMLLGSANPALMYRKRGTLCLRTLRNAWTIGHAKSA